MPGPDTVPATGPGTALTRRVFLTTGLGGLAAGLVGCSRAADGDSTPRGDGITWWDQYAPQKAMEQRLFAGFAASAGGLAVDYTVFDPSKMGQAQQLAHSSGQLPDVMSLAVPVQPKKLVEDGWFRALDLPQSARDALPEGSLLPGFSVFDDKVYSLPLRTFRQHDSLAWYNAGLLQKAGVDPENGLASWDDFRAASRAVTRVGGTGVFGWVAPLQFPDRLAAQVTQLAMTVGPTGSAGVPDGTALFDPRTGDYVLDSDAVVAAIEFLLSMKADRSLYPASSLLTARSARARWATGVVGLFLDGSYNIGVVVSSFPEFADQLGVAAMPAADPGTVIAAAPQGGGQAFWLTAGSRHPEAATTLIAKFATAEIQKEMAEAMDAIPLDIASVADSDAHPTYKRAAEIFTRQVVLAPNPVARNPEVADVLSEMSPITPGLGEIVQGVFSGQVSDIRGTLRTLNDRLSTERERAAGVVAGRGGKASLADWVFEDWRPGTDYGQKAADS